MSNRLMHSALQAGVKLFITRAADNRDFEILEVNEGHEAIIADEEGLRKVVELHTDDCPCQNKEFIVKDSEADKVKEWHTHTSLKIDFDIIEKWKDVIDPQAEPTFGRGDYISYKDDELVIDTQTPRNSLVYVHSVMCDKRNGGWVFYGHTTNGQTILPVTGECWRFMKISTDTFK